MLAINLVAISGVPWCSSIVGDDVIHVLGLLLNSENVRIRFATKPLIVTQNTCKEWYRRNRRAADLQVTYGFQGCGAHEYNIELSKTELSFSS